MTEKIELKINGLSVTADSGMTILDAALRKGIYIPHLCHHRQLEPIGACRLCLVEIQGEWKKNSHFLQDSGQGRHGCINRDTRDPENKTD